MLEQCIYCRSSLPRKQHHLMSSPGHQMFAAQLWYSHAYFCGMTVCGCIMNYFVHGFKISKFPVTLGHTALENDERPALWCFKLCERKKEEYDIHY